MIIGNTVRIRRDQKAQRNGYTEWQRDYMPNTGTVEYISPHGWALVRVHSRRTGKAIYAEAFDVCQLHAVRRKAKEDHPAR